MSQALTGKRHSYDSASTRPEVAAKIRDWWTPERREARRLQSLAVNPGARYHGLSASGAKRLRLSVGECQSCGATGHLDIHHRDRDKRNQDLANLAVLCHRCHMQEHAQAGETGWDRFHQRRAAQSNPAAQ